MDKDKLIAKYEEYVKWLKTKPSKKDIAHAIYESEIASLKSEIESEKVFDHTTFQSQTDNMPYEIKWNGITYIRK